MATFSIHKLVSELQAHKFNSHGIELVIEQAPDVVFSKREFGTMSVATRKFPVEQSILQTFINEIQEELDTLNARFPDVHRYGIFPFMYFAGTHPSGESYQMMRYAKSTRTKQMEREQMTTNVSTS